MGMRSSMVDDVWDKQEAERRAQTVEREGAEESPREQQRSAAFLPFKRNEIYFSACPPFQAIGQEQLGRNGFYTLIFFACFFVPL